MPGNFPPNLDPRYYSQPASYQGTIGAAAITAFPTAVSVLGTQSQASFVFTSNTLTSITINGTLINFTSSGFSLKTAQASNPILPFPGANGVVMPWQAMAQFGANVAIGTTLGETLLNLLAFLRSYPDENLQACYYRLIGNSIVVYYGLTGTAGNSVALAASGSGVTITGAATSGAASQTTGNTSGFLYGGTAVTSGYSVVVEPQLNPIELQYAYALPKGASWAAGTMTMFLGSTYYNTLRKTDAITYPSQTALSTTQEYSPIPFTGISSTLVRTVPPFTGLYAYTSIAQLADIYAGPGGVY